MIIVNLKGGLGNQMFQYALGRTLALKNNDEFKLDISGYPKQDLRQYELSAFKIKEKIATSEEIKKIKYPYGLVSKLRRGISSKLLRQHHIGWEPSILIQKGNIYLDGYWQSYKYFEDNSEIIRQDFDLKSELKDIQPSLSAKATQPGSISLHLRRTDYLSNKKHLSHFGSLSLSYYNEAIKRLKKDNSFLVVFTDDPVWAKSNLKTGLPQVFVADYGLSAPQELILMSWCEKHIIANSSFSWWGAWLDPKPNKSVVAPKNWTNGGEPRSSDIIPPSWEKI